MQSVSLRLSNSKITRFVWRERVHFHFGWCTYERHLCGHRRPTHLVPTSPDTPFKAKIGTAVHRVTFAPLCPTNRLQFQQYRNYREWSGSRTVHWTLRRIAWPKTSSIDTNRILAVRSREQQSIEPSLHPFASKESHGEQLVAHYHHLFQPLYNFVAGESWCAWLARMPRDRREKSSEAAGFLESETSRGWESRRGGERGSRVREYKRK